MEKILVVARTKMRSGICVGGLTSSGRSVRLMRKGHLNQPLDTEFDIGQVWEADIHDSLSLEPPHLEDVIVSHQRYIGNTTKMREKIMQHSQPWRGGLEALFDQRLIIGQKNCYVAKSGPIPNHSTGFWLPNRALTLYRENEKPRYLIRYGFDTNERDISMPFVGCISPVECILPGTLVRVSLARWFQSSGSSEERCYLQLSGWYLQSGK